MNHEDKRLSAPTLLELLSESWTVYIGDSPRFVLAEAVEWLREQGA